MSEELERLAEEFVASQVALDEAKRVKSDAEKSNALAKVKLYEGITQRNLRSYDHAELGKFRPRLEPHVSLKKASLDEQGEVQDEDSRKALEAWAKTRQIDENTTLFDVLFYFAVKSARLKTVVKDLLSEGEDLPPGVEKYDERTITWSDKPEKFKKQKVDSE